MQREIENNCLWLHKWTKWTTPEYGKAHHFSALLNKEWETECMYQERTCQRCGKYEVMEVEIK